MNEQAIVYRGAGGREVIEHAELPESHRRPPAPGEVAVEVHAVGLNRADILQRRGFYPAPPGVEPNVPGLEFAGVVSETNAAQFSTGDRVMGITGGGAFSTRLIVPADELVSVPTELELTSAAAVPEAFFTAYDAMVRTARLAVGERVLIHAAASGVGTAAIQIASRCGAMVLGTSRTATKLDGLAELGLNQPIVCTDGSFAETVLTETEDAGVDVILDLVGGSYFSENLRALAPKGRMVIIGLLGGIKAEAPLAVILAKRLEIHGSVLRSRSHAEKAALAADVARNLVPMFARGELSPVIDQVLPMSEIGRAHELLETNATRGKLVLTW